MWTATFALTLLFFAIQFGTGFSILAIAPAKVIAKCRLTKAQFIVLGGTIGASATAILLGLISLLTSDIRLQLGLVIALSCFGVGMTWPTWRPRPCDARTLALWCVLSLPMALMTWWWTFGAFSHFPFGDIGADVHWMKIAQEYADGGVLNPYATQSYIDLRSALAGALSGMIGLDLLQFSWTYRFCSILFVLLTLYAFADGVYPDAPQRKWITFILAGAGNSIGLLTNGSLALAASIAFLGVLLGNLRERDAPKAVPVLLLIASVAATLIVSFLLNNNTLLLVLIMGGLLVLRLKRSTNYDVAILFIGCIWPAALILAHRGSYLFVPIALAAWSCYALILFAMSRWPARSSRVLYALSLGLPLVIGGMVGAVIAMRLGYISSTNANEVFSRITGLALGRTITTGEELFLGAGPQVATIELGRAMGPLFAICVTLAVVWCWAIGAADPSGPMEDETRAAYRSKLLWAWTFGCGVSLAVLSGFPFLYRATPLVLSLFTITATEAFCLLLIDPQPSPRHRRMLAAGTIVLLASVLIIGVYAFAWRTGLPYASYQAFLRPMEIAAIVVLVALLPFTLARSKPIYLCSLVAVVALGIAADRAGLATISRIYSYGPRPESAAAVSHYDAEDLAAARWLHTHLHKGIVISDPYTQGLIQALTGVPSGYLFSNLDTVNEAIATQVKAMLAATFEDQDGSRLGKACSLVTPLLKSINQQTVFQMHRKDALEGILKPVRTVEQPGPSVVSEPQIASKEEQHSTVERVLKGDNGSSWHLVAVINPRTIEWIHLPADRRLGYFPPDGPMQPDVVKTLGDGTLPLLFSDQRTMVVQIPCGE